MNTTVTFLSGCIAVLVTACSAQPRIPMQPPVHQIGEVTQSPRSRESRQPEKPVPAERKLQLTLAEEALKLAFRQYELSQLASRLRRQGNPVPSEIHEEMDTIDIRQKAIADQQFSLSGQLFLKAAEPGEFASYIEECLNEINSALAAEDPELRHRFYGKTALVQIDLKAGGKIESVIPQPLKNDKEFGDYLHDLVWKVPNFPAVPQLKGRRIERVSISVSLTLQSGNP